VSDDTRLGGRVPAVLRIRLKHASLDAFVERFSVNISRGGIFIASRTPHPVGTVLRFEFQLQQGTPVVRGEGEVIWVKEFDPEAPTKPHGMGVRFTRLDAESRAVIDRALAWKEAHGVKRKAEAKPAAEAKAAPKGAPAEKEKPKEKEKEKERPKEKEKEHEEDPDGPLISGSFLALEEEKPSRPSKGLPPGTVTEAESAPKPVESAPKLAAAPLVPPPRQRKMTLPPPIPADAQSSVISSAPPPRAARSSQTGIVPPAAARAETPAAPAPAPRVEPPKPAEPKRAEPPKQPEPRSPEPPRRRELPRLEMPPRRPPLDDHGANGADLDTLAREWGISDERLAATIARVRADPPATSDEELARIAGPPRK
jgi:uncharacterized protein (TIGR02266 family)